MNMTPVPSLFCFKTTEIKRNQLCEEIVLLPRQGILTEGEGSSTVDLLIKVTCFLNDANNIFNMKRS